MAVEAAQALKWASFISSFQAYFQKLSHFRGGYDVPFLIAKTSTLVVSVGSLWIVTVRTCSGVLLWKIG